MAPTPPMILTYTHYIESYLSHEKYHRGKAAIPGEHHFVSAYLLPRIYEITGQVPDYINPDGMKKVLGDIVYTDEEGETSLSIEVKLGTIRLSRREYNEWIVPDPKEGPDSPKDPVPALFIGIGTDGLALCPWADFRAAYLGSVRERKGKCWTPARIDPGKYGPSTSINGLLNVLLEGQVFCSVESGQEGAAQEQEKRFTEALAKAICLAQK